MVDRSGVGWHMDTGTRSHSGVPLLPARGSDRVRGREDRNTKESCFVIVLARCLSIAALQNKRQEPVPIQSGPSSLREPAPTSLCRHQDLVLVRLEPSQSLQHERRHQRDQRDAEQRRRHRTLQQRQGIAEADRQRAAQLAFGDRSEDETMTTGAIGKSNRRIKKPITPKPASIDSSTTDGFAAMVPWSRTREFRRKATAAGSRAVSPTSRPAAD